MNYPAILTDISELVNRLDQRFNKLDQKFIKLDQRFTNLDQKFDTLEQRFSKIEERLDKLEISQADIKEEIKALGNKIIDPKKKHLTVVEKKTPEPSKRFGELKNWRKITFVIITTMVGLFVGRVTNF